MRLHWFCILLILIFLPASLMADEPSDNLDLAPLPLFNPNEPLASPIFSIQRVGIFDFQGYSVTPGNPSTGLARLYYNLSTAQLVCINSDGSSCLSSSGGIPLNAVSLSQFGAQGGTQSHFINDATFTISSGNVSSSSNDVPFLASDCAPPGTGCVGTSNKITFGTNCNSQGGPSCITASVVLPEGTISGFTDTHHITVSTNSSVNCSAACTFVWGVDDTTPFKNAYAALAPNCSGPLYIPSGIFMIQDQPTSLVSTLQCINNAQTSRQGVSAIGNGYSNSYLVPTPNYPANKGIFPDALSYAANLTIYGADNNSTVSTTGSAISFTTTSMANNVYCVGWQANSSGFNGIAFGGTASFYSQMESDRCGSTGASALGDYTFISNSYIGDNITTGLSVSTSGTVYSSNNAYSGVGGGSPVILISSGNFNETGDEVTNANAGGGNSVIRCGGNCHLHNTRILQSGTGNPSNGLRVLSGGTAEMNGGECSAPGTHASCLLIDSGGQLTASNINPLSGTVAGINNSGTFIDGGNNGSTTYTGSGTVFGSGSITGTAASSSNFANTTNLGTSSYTVASNSSSMRGTVTITYAGTLASPTTFTFTFPAAFFVAPSSCVWTLANGGGTNTAPTSIIPSTPSATSIAVVSTFASSPTASNTTIYQWNCGN